MASGDENNRTAEALGFGDAEAGGARGFAPSHFHFCVTSCLFLEMHRNSILFGKPKSLFDVVNKNFD